MRKNCRTICTVLLVSLLWNIGTVFARGTYNEWYSLFPKSTISIAYLGDSKIFTPSLTGKAAKSIGEKYDKPVSNIDLTKNNAVSADISAAAASAAGRKPDLVFVAASGADEDGAVFKENIESAVRILMEANRDTKIVFVAMPQDAKTDSLTEVGKYYNIGTIRFDEYVERRTKAEVFAESEIISGGLTEKGAEVLAECIVYFADSVFLVPTYVAESMSGKQSPGVPDTAPGQNKDEQKNELTGEEADAILAESTIVSIYRNYAVQNGERVALRGGEVLPGRLDGKLCYPVGTAKQLFGVGVRYLPKEKAVVLTKGTKTMEMNFQNSSVLLDGETVDIEYPMILYKSTTYLPEKAISLLNGTNVCSDGKIGVIYPESYNLSAAEQNILTERAKVLYAEVE